MEMIKKDGFTLIELLITIAILGIIGGVGSAIFFTSLKTTSKAEIAKEVKQNGDYALTIMERMIRNAKSVSSCTGGTVTSLLITNQDGGQTTFAFNLGTKIASVSSVPLGTYYLTNDKVILTGIANNFTCMRVVNRPDTVRINFSLSQANAAARAEETANTTFQTTVSLRTY